MTNVSTSLTIRLFATLKDRAGASRITIPFEQPMSVSAMLAVVGEHTPAVAPILPSALIAVNRNFATLEQVVQLGDEVALFPPMSGG